jgi:ABC-type sugar transport system substrate-binding protein
MNRMFKTFAVALLALLCVVGTAIAGGGGGEKGEVAGEEKITIAYTGYPGGLTAFWAQMAQYMKEEADALGVELLDMSPTTADAAVQKDSVDNAINRGVDGIIIGAIDNRAFGESLDRANTKGIPVVAVDTAIDHPHISALAQTDNLASARVLGQYIVDTTEKGTVIILGGTLGHQTGDARRDGVKQVLEANGYNVVFRACNWDPATALETATNELAANPETVAVFGCWDPGALAGLSAVKQRGLLGKVKVYGFDGLPDALKSIKDGELTATIKQDNKQMARVSLNALVGQIKGQESVKKLLIDGFVIDASNVDEHM